MLLNEFVNQIRVVLNRVVIAVGFWRFSTALKVDRNDLVVGHERRAVGNEIPPRIQAGAKAVDAQERRAVFSAVNLVIHFDQAAHGKLLCRTLRGMAQSVPRLEAQLTRVAGESRVLSFVSCVLADYIRTIHEITPNRTNKAASCCFVDRFARQADLSELED